MTIRLGIAGEGDCFHARAVASVVHGEQKPGGDDRGVFEKFPGLDQLAEICCVWDPIRSNAERLAERFGISRVAYSAAELAEKVDGVLVLGDRTMEFQRHAPQFLESGVPCYVDKPLSPNLDEARSIVELARRTGTPFFSASPPRFAPQLESLRGTLSETVGQPIALTLIGPGELFFYGVHLVDIMISLLGKDVVEVVNIGRPEEELIKVSYKNGVWACIQVLSKAHSRFHVMALGTDGWNHVYIDNYRDYFAHLVKSVCEMVSSGRAPVALDEVLRVIEVLTAARISRERAQPVSLPLAEEISY